MHIFLPENFSPEKDVVGYKKIYREKYLWMIHTVIDEFNKNENDFDGYVNLQSEILGHFMGERYYAGIIKQLEKSKIIDINPHYLKDEFSRSYRLTPQYANQNIISIPFDSVRAAGYVTKFNNWNQKYLNEIQKVTVYKTLFDNLYKIKFDCKKATLYLRNNVGSYNHDQINSRKWVIEKFSNKDYFFKVDEKTGRAYNNLTSLPREFRQFVSFKGTRLMQLDIANSQPLLLCTLFEKYWTSYQKFVQLVYSQRKDQELALNMGVFKILNDYRKIEIADEEKTEYDGHAAYPAIIYLTELPSVKFPSDILQYIDLTQRGKFYDEFMEYLKANGETEVPERSAFKEEFFKRVFFNSVDRTNTYLYEKWLFKWMPHVLDAIYWYKREDYKNLSNLMQKNEATVIIKNICAELLALNPVPYFLTIHDSIICNKKHAKKIKQIMLNNYKTLFDLVPTIKIEQL